MPRSLKYPDLFAILLITITVLCVFAQTFSHQLLGYDDPYFVSHVPQVTSGLSWDNFKWAWTTSEMSIWHPLTWFSFQLETELFGAGNDGARFVTNTFLHLVNCLLVYLISQQLGFSKTLALIISLLFAVHPQHVEVVAWISNRKELLASGFVLLSFWQYLDYRNTHRQRSYFFSLFFFVLALLSKVSAAPLAILLPLIGLLDILFKSPGKKLPPEGWLRFIVKWLPFLLVAIFVSAITINLQAADVSEKLHSLESSLNYLSMIGVRFAWYLRMSFWPAPLSMLHPLPASISGFMIAYSTLSITVFFALVWRFRSNQIFLIGISWFILFLAPTSGIVPVDAIYVSDRYSYQAHIGLFIAILAVLKSLTSGSAGRVISTRVLQIALFLLIAIFAFISWKQVALWENTITLFERETLLKPTNETPLIQLGYAHFLNKDYDAAQNYLSRAIAVNPYGFYGYAYQGFLEESLANYAQAEHWYLLAIEHNEPYKYHHVVDVYEHLVWISSTLEKHPQAVDYLKQGLGYYPDSEYLKELSDYYRKYYPQLSKGLQ